MLKDLLSNPQLKNKSWLITGAAGFIGSHLVEQLLKHDQKVTGVDNLSTGFEKNLAEIKNTVSPKQWENFEFINGDVANTESYEHVVDENTLILHHAALASVPESTNQPERFFENNVVATRRLFDLATQKQARRLVYASSSAVYGDDPAEKKSEDITGRRLSPYADNKWQNELDAAEWNKTESMEIVGLRYFNVFGPRQDPKGAYAAVIPAWVSALTHNQTPKIYGTGENTRDFCYVENVVVANILCALKPLPKDAPWIFNVGTGNAISLLELLTEIKNATGSSVAPDRLAKREGDILHSRASIVKIKTLIGFQPVVDFSSGLKKTILWFQKNS